MPKSKICRSCKGKTWCSTCRGEGKVGKWVTKKCPVCNGRANCQRCGGAGKVKYIGIDGAERPRS
jgi:DnaJ-class molecular chaperone